MTYKVYPYRWAVLAVFAFVNVTIQMLWVTYTPIMGPAAAFYSVSDLQIGFLSMSFMIAFIPLRLCAGIFPHQRDAHCHAVRRLAMT